MPKGNKMFGDFDPSKTKLKSRAALNSAMFAPPGAPAADGAEQS